MDTLTAAYRSHPITLACFRKVKGTTHLPEHSTDTVVKHASTFMKRYSRSDCVSRTIHLCRLSRASFCNYLLQKRSKDSCDWLKDNLLAYSMIVQFLPNAQTWLRCHPQDTQQSKSGWRRSKCWRNRRQHTYPRTSAPLRLLQMDVNKLTPQTPSRGKETAAAVSARPLLFLPPPISPSLFLTLYSLSLSQALKPINSFSAWSAAKTASPLSGRIPRGWDAASVA